MERPADAAPPAAAPRPTLVMLVDLEIDDDVVGGADAAADKVARDLAAMLHLGLTQAGVKVRDVAPMVARRVEPPAAEGADR